MNEILNKKCTKIRENEWQIKSFTLKNSYIIRKKYDEYAIYLQNTGSVTKIGILENEQDFNAFVKIFI